MTRLPLALTLAALILATPLEAQNTTVPDTTRIDIDADTEGTQEWRQSVDERDRQAVESARETGGTVISAQVGEATASAAEAEETQEADEPTAAAAAGYEHQDAPVTIHSPAAVVGQAYDVPGAAPLPGQDLSDLLAVLIEEWSRPPEIVAISYDAASPRPEDEAPPAAAPGPPAVTLAIEAGRPLYARTLYEVNSDFPGPVLLEILEPPLAGAVATGAFTRVRDAMVLRLARIEIGGVSSAVDGWAVGLDCACFGIDGEVDRHWFDRVIVPAAVAFVEGWATAIARPQTTVNVDGGVVVQSTAAATSEERLYEGIAAATGPAAAMLQEDAPRQMTVRIPRNTELAVTFASSPDIAGIAAGFSEAP